MINIILIQLKNAKLSIKGMQVFGHFPVLLTFLVLTLLINISSCTPEIDVPGPHPGNAVFTKTVAIGGNYMAGYQDGALFLKGQKFSIPALITKQFELVDGEHFNQSLMPDDKGLGLTNTGFTTAAHLGYKTDCKGISILTPIQDSISIADAAPYLSGIAGNGVQNFAVPFATIPNYFDPAFGKSFSSGNKNPYYNRIASNPGVSNIYEDAKAQNATFIIAWLGMEDIYNYAGNGGKGSLIPSSANFSTSLDILLGGITANGAKGVIANIPDFRTLPYYSLIKWNSLETTQAQADSLNYFYNTLSGIPQIHFSSGKNGLIINDTNAAGGYRQLHSGEYVTLSFPQDSMKCSNYGLLPSPVDNRYVLDSTEVFVIDQAINSYNLVIMQKAEQYRLAFVDMYSYFNSVNTGIKWNGASLNTEFITGGFFSLDGYHPNQRGYALIANEYIKAINTKYSSVIPTVNCVECDGILFP